ncbi:MAG: acyl-CoA dehydrogenase family protein [Clostridiales bacterium]|uniref:Acyl-CoA dehydrogenase family protein n=2 Tax=Intestinimonas massiliensis (ex Afouda et al. 2020) TaxID=1673721 RepID=A0AAW5JW23_9FIRM|nr:MULTISPECIES: acyl-CoA dehydrogenase family protein [Intestinimonas]MCQ4771778.1 acyl-CoA dehydrogenase family protein [Intestinimonas massiliensis (ex Afouda et al. 2020)]MCQ4807302.1 acyl-CoA dehydrogenase family protein [Intestinimonas massiliensis (ex Afouda et al. 2020)]MDU1325127.1 acyl-CoA dehydrogenase family protein [Clostridiales bacterium]
MNFTLNENQLAIQSTVKAFAEKELAKDILVRDAAAEFPHDLYAKMGEMGLIGLPYPKEYGGQGEDYLSYILAVEEVSKVDGAMGISYSVSTSLYGGSLTNSQATEEQLRRFLTPVASGKSLGSFALTEPTAGSDVAGARTLAVRDGDDYVINGSKCFITNGPLSDYFAVYALTDKEAGPKSMACFVVEKGTPGFVIGTRHNTMGLRSAMVCELYFTDCRVPVANMIAAPGKGFGLAMKTLDGGRIGVGAQGLGIAEGAWEIARKYLMERQQFGKPLCKQQTIAFKMAELAIEIEQAKYMVYKAALEKGEGQPYSISAAKAKYCGTNAAMHVTTEAVQLLGGNGYMKEFHVERMMRDAKITQIYEGTNEIQKMIVSGTLFQ